MANTNKMDAEARKAKKIEAVGQLGGMLGDLVTYGMGGKLVELLLKNHQKIPGALGGKDIKKLEEHFVAALGRQDPKLGPQISQTLKDIGKSADSFIKKHNLQDVAINVGNAGKTSVLSDYYNPIKNTVNLSTASEAVALHELGHAADIRGSLTKTVARHAFPTLTAMAVPLALSYGDYIKKKIPGSIDDKVITAIQNHPFLTGMAGYTVSTLYPEAKASLLALRHIKDTHGTEKMLVALKKSLGPAYGTYLLGSLPLLAGIAFTKAMHQKHQKKTASASDNVLKSKAFWAGFASAAIPTAAIVGYQTGTRGGKHLSDLQDHAGSMNVRIIHGTEVEEQHRRFMNTIRGWTEKHPIATTATTSLGAGTAIGLLLHDTMKNVPIAKALKHKL